jgi:uncharacterized protein
MDCPKCDGALAEVSFGGVKVDRCGECAGLWFDAREVRALVAAGGELAADSPAKAGAALDDVAADCPRCHEPLMRIESMAVEGLHYDQCGNCRGAWLDAGELHQILSDPSAGEVIKFFNELE